MGLYPIDSIFLGKANDYEYFEVYLPNPLEDFISEVEIGDGTSYKNCEYLKIGSLRLLYMSLFHVKMRIKTHYILYVHCP